MATTKIQTGLRLPEQLYNKLTALAKLENRSMNNLVEYAVQRYIAEYERTNGVIRPLEKE